MHWSYGWTLHSWSVGCHMESFVSHTSLGVEDMFHLPLWSYLYLRPKLQFVGTLSSISLWIHRSFYIFWQIHIFSPNIHIFQNSHFSKFTFFKIHIFQKSHFPKITFFKNHIFKNSHFSRITLIKNHIFQNSHGSKITFSEKVYYVKQKIVFYCSFVALSKDFSKPVTKKSWNVVGPESIGMAQQIWDVFKHLPVHKSEDLLCKTDTRRGRNSWTLSEIQQNSHLALNGPILIALIVSSHFHLFLISFP